MTIQTPGLDTRIAELESAHEQLKTHDWPSESSAKRHWDDAEKLWLELRKRLARARVEADRALMETDFEIHLLIDSIRTGYGRIARVLLEGEPK